MELVTEEQKKKKGRGKKIVGISIIVLIIILFILVSAIFAVIKLDNEMPKLNVNNKRYNMPANLMVMWNDGNRYVAINGLAKYVGYEFYNGEYKEYTEDKSKGYVECEDEVASFTADSNIVYKNNSKEKINFDTYELKHPIKIYNDTLYAAIDDIGIIFNTNILFREENNTLVIQTLPYLTSYYKKVAERNGYDGISEDFITQKSIKYGMLVVKKDETYGVVSTKDFSRIIGTRYDKIVFIESTQEFVVTSEGKTGLISNTGETKIDLRYEDIGLIDTQSSLYYAKNNDLMGVLNGNGRVIVYLEYAGIGFDREQYPYENIKNNMFLYKNCIPIMKTEKYETTNAKGEVVVNLIKKWGLADKLGNILLPAEYDSLGYAETEIKDRSINNVIVVPSVNGIVMGKDGKYGVINALGRILIPCEFDKIYSITNEGKDEFYLEQSGKTVRLERFITDNKIIVATPEEQQKYNENEENNTNTNTNVNTNTNANTNTNNTVNNNTTNVLNSTVTNNTSNTSSTNNGTITTVIM